MKNNQQATSASAWLSSPFIRRIPTNNWVVPVVVLPRLSVTMIITN